MRPWSRHTEAAPSLFAPLLQVRAGWEEGQSLTRIHHSLPSLYLSWVSFDSGVEDNPSPHRKTRRVCRGAQQPAAHSGGDQCKAACVRRLLRMCVRARGPQEARRRTGLKVATASMLANPGARC